MEVQLYNCIELMMNASPTTTFLLAPLLRRFPSVFRHYKTFCARAMKASLLFFIVNVTFIVSFVLPHPPYSLNHRWRTAPNLPSFINAAPVSNVISRSPYSGWTHTSHSSTTSRMPPLHSTMSLAEVLDENIPPSPTFESSKLLVFMCSIILLWLSEPVLSLIDSSIVGRSSPLALAAMGPATMILDSAIYLCWFLGISTTNLLASTNPPPSNDNEPTKAHRNIIRNALSTASLLGVVVTLLLRFQATPITAAITGSANAAIVPTAVTYVRLRSLAAPFAIVGQACQATCLTSGDVVTPALAVLAASLTNIVLDFTLCIKPFNYGIAGAAFATGVSNVVSTLVLLRAVHERFFKPTKSSMISLPTAEELSDLFR